MGMKHKAKRIARDAGMPNCGHDGAFLYVTPPPHGFAGNDQMILTHYRLHECHVALVALHRAAGRGDWKRA